MAKSITVGISDARVSRDSDATLVTYALGSCIAVVAHDPIAKVGGMLHFMLPESTICSDRAQVNPFMYADTGIPLLLRQMLENGAVKHRLRIHVAGGAHVLNDQGFFNVGQRNHVSMRKALWKAGLFVHSDATGGTLSRTVWLDVGSGQVRIKEGAGLAKELPAALHGGLRANANTGC